MERESKRTALAGAAVFCLIAAGCRKPAMQHFAMPAPLVTVTKAVSRDVPVYLDEFGQGAAFNAITVMPQVSGMLQEQKFTDGADVKKGDLLYTIDPLPFKAQLDSANAQLAQAQAQRAQAQASLDLAESQLKRYAEVAGIGAVSKSDYDTRKSAVDVGTAQVKAAEAAVKAAEAAVETANLNLQYCYIHSPVDGRAGKTLVNAGNVVTANQTALLTIEQVDPLYVDFTVTEQDLPQVKEMMKRGTLNALVRLPSEPEDAARAAEVNFLDNTVQNGTGTITMRATVQNADRRFWPGQFVYVRLILETMKNAVLVPNSAPQISQQGPYVFVITPDGTADLKTVTLGQREGALTVVEKGLAAGEEIVTTGQLAIIPGGKVRIVESGGEAGPGAGGGGPTGGGERGGGRGPAAGGGAPAGGGGGEK